MSQQEKGSGINTRWCHTCQVRFSIITRRKIRRRQLFCPICGESADVWAYDKRPRPEGFRKNWTLGEISELHRLATLGHTSKEIAIKLGRTLDSVRNKRRLKRIGKCYRKNQNE